jgi:hypothetical protein
MKCTEAEKQIDSFIDNELNPSLADKVELHLEECRGCEETFKSLQALRRIIRKDIFVAASSQLDERVSEAFSRHHENKQKKNWRAVVFGQIVISKPAFATALLLFAVFTGLAFQFGKMTATDVRLEMPITETVNPPPQISEPNLFSKSATEFEDKTSDAPVIKFIEVPVVKEKIVTRVVYVNKQPGKENSIKAGSAKSKPDNFALNSSVNENRYSTQVNLKKFQPIAEMKVKITKKGENYEK